MDFKKHLKNLLIIVVFCMIGNSIYDKFIRIGFNSVYINTNNICSISDNAYYKIVLNEKEVIIIKDPYNKITTLILDKDDLVSKLKIECSQNKKLFILSTTVGLKTKYDSLGIGEKNNKLHGYMGVWEKNNCYDVDQNGIFVRCDRI